MSARWSTTATPAATTAVEDETTTNSRYIDSLLLRMNIAESLISDNTGLIAGQDTELDTLSAEVATNAADILTIEGQLSAVSWSSWTPTYTNLTVGNGTVLARYRVDGRTMHFTFEFLLGSTSAIGTNPKIGLPSGWTIYDDGVNQSRVPFVAMAFDSSAGQWYSGAAVAGDAANDVLTTRIIFGSTAVAAGAPFTWAAGDILMTSGTAEVEPV